MSRAASKMAMLFDAVDPSGDYFRYRDALTNMPGIVMALDYNQVQGTRVPDLSGLANHGTAGSSAIIGLDGPTSAVKSCKHDGTANGIITGVHSASLDFERTNPFSISLWINAPSGQDVGLFSKCATDTSAGYDLDWSPGRNVYFIIRNTYPTNLIRLMGTAAISLNVWHHIVATYDGSSTAAGTLLYIDGVQVAKTLYADTLSASIKNVTGIKIGAVGGYRLNGQTAFPAVANVAWSAEQVRFLFENV